MRFKAKLSPHHVELLYNLIAPISRLHGGGKATNSGGVGGGDDGSKSKSGDTIVYLDDDKMILSTHGVSSNSSSSGGAAILTNSGGPSQPQTQTQTMTQSTDAEGIFCFAELMTTQGIFREHVIESLSEGNAILMEISLSSWRTALRNILKSHCGKNANMIMNGTGSESMIGSVLVENEDGYQAGTFNEGNSSESRNGASGGKRKRVSAGGFLGVVDITMKLAKRNGGLPHLCLDAKTNGGRGLLGIEAHYAIPVRIMRTDEFQYHIPPRMNRPDVQLELPRDRPLKAVVDRLRGISKHLYIEGSMAGMLSLRVDSEGASIRTVYNQLIPLPEDCKFYHEEANQSDEDHTNGDDSASIDNNDHNNGSNSQNRQSNPSQHTTRSSMSNNEPVKCKVKVDTKKMHASLHWQGTLSPREVSSAVLCMWENEMLVLDVTLNPEVGRFMYYVPVHYLSDDWN